MELFLAKLLGIYLIVIGVMVYLRKKSVIPTMRELLKNRALLLVIGVIELAAGIALVLAYPFISWSLEGAFSIIGYSLIVESVVYLGAPAHVVQKVVGRFNKPLWYKLGAVLAVVVGAYLTGTGFGLF